MVEAHHRHIHKIIGFLIISFLTGGSSARRQAGPGEGSEEICQNIKDNTLIFRPGKVLIWIFNSTVNVKLLFSILILHPIYVKLQPTHILTAVLTLSYFHLLLCKNSTFLPSPRQPGLLTGWHVPFSKFYPKQLYLEYSRCTLFFTVRPIWFFR